ncbi:BrnT family toxin [Nitrospirillum sp. BR 11163]|uniref:BrnT family toxin n=1 Tax=Nitrospirillum sp. BR 11163 TaxID=3104323 RepID=UPI002AFF128B|nr:BrnT family toxin [Nitrospirillum sp. BR 11163]MEA1676350.1 BrnT family toxin [Nitrospirillum sp. BR 11163]
MNWVWDARKARANIAKHKVSFELAERVFGDPFAITVPDPYPDEARWRTIGRPYANLPGVLFVVHTDTASSGGIGHIISARRATPAERKAYEEG